jgi:hypothetical protein
MINTVFPSLSLGPRVTFPGSLVEARALSKENCIARSTSTAGRMRMIHNRFAQLMPSPAIRDGLADISERHPELSIPKDWRSELLQLTDQSAVDLSLDLIRAHSSRSITYIALGPLTNLARMMRQEATLITDRIGRVIAMGGALEAAGNVTAVAECGLFPVFRTGFNFSHLQSISLLTRPPCENCCIRRSQLSACL